LPSLKPMGQSRRGVVRVMGAQVRPLVEANLDIAFVSGCVYGFVTVTPQIL
jgi:hypothetical protein